MASPDKDKDLPPASPDEEKENWLVNKTNTEKENDFIPGSHTIAHQDSADSSLQEENTLSACLMKILHDRDGSGDLIDLDTRDSFRAFQTTSSPIASQENELSQVAGARPKHSPQMSDNVPNYLPSPDFDEEDKMRKWREAGVALRKALSESRSSNTDGAAKTPVSMTSSLTDDPMNSMLDDFMKGPDSSVLGPVSGDQGKTLNNTEDNKETIAVGSNTKVQLESKHNHTSHKSEVSSHAPKHKKSKRTDAKDSSKIGEDVSEGLANVREKIKQITSRISVNSNRSSPKSHTSKLSRSNRSQRHSSSKTGSSSESEEEIEAKRHKYVQKSQRTRSSSRSPQTSLTPSSSSKDVPKHSPKGSKNCSKCGGIVPPKHKLKHQRHLAQEISEGVTPNGRDLSTENNEHCSPSVNPCPITGNDVKSTNDNLDLNRDEHLPDSLPELDESSGSDREIRNFYLSRRDKEECTPQENLSPLRGNEVESKKENLDLDHDEVLPDSLPELEESSGSDKEIRIPKLIKTSNNLDLIQDKILPDSVPALDESSGSDGEMMAPELISDGTGSDSDSVPKLLYSSDSNNEAADEYFAQALDQAKKASERKRQHHGKPPGANSPTSFGQHAPSSAHGAASSAAINDNQLDGLPELISSSEEELGEAMSKKLERFVEKLHSPKEQGHNEGCHRHDHRRHHSSRHVCSCNVSRDQQETEGADVESSMHSGDSAILESEGEALQGTSSNFIVLLLLIHLKLYLIFLVRADERYAKSQHT